MEWRFHYGASGTLPLVLVQLVCDPWASAGTMTFRLALEFRKGRQLLLPPVARFILRPLGHREPARRALSAASRPASLQIRIPRYPGIQLR